MSSKEPISPFRSGQTPFQRLSAGSVGDAANIQGAGGAGGSVLHDDARFSSASVLAASLRRLEKAVVSTSESARLLNVARVAAEEVGLANRASAQTDVRYVDSAVNMARISLRSQGKASGKVHKSRLASCSSKGL